MTGSATDVRPCFPVDTIKGCIRTNKSVRRHPGDGADLSERIYCGVAPPEGLPFKCHAPSLAFIFSKLHQDYEGRTWLFVSGTHTHPHTRIGEWLQTRGRILVSFLWHTLFFLPLCFFNFILTQNRAVTLDRCIPPSPPALPQREVYSRASAESQCVSLKKKKKKNGAPPWSLTSCFIPQIPPKTPAFRHSPVNLLGGAALHFDAGHDLSL